MNEAAVAFTAPQLAIICGILGAAVIWGFQRLISSIDGRFKEIRQDVADIRAQMASYPTRNEMHTRIRATERRVDDIALFIHTRTNTGTFILPSHDFGEGSE